MSLPLMGVICMEHNVLPLRQRDSFTFLNLTVKCFRRAALTKIYNTCSLIRSLREHWNSPGVWWHFTVRGPWQWFNLWFCKESSTGNKIINRSNTQKGRVRIKIVIELQPRLWSLRYGLKSRRAFNIWNITLSRSFSSRLQYYVLISHSKIAILDTVRFLINY